MLNHEVTNSEYQKFLKWVESHGTEEEKAEVSVRSNNWDIEFKKGLSKYAEHYHTHEAYSDYPVVNVTHEAANLYCEWMEKQINSQLKSGSVKVRLPKHAEVIRAGAGDSLKASYAWRDYHMRQPSGEFRGNFLYVPQSRITKDDNGNFVLKPIDYGKIQNSTDLTAPSKSYWKFSYGFYNLNGNVAEMIEEPGVAVGGSCLDYGYDIRLQSRKMFDKVSCTVGFRPVFTIVD
jgi:formylglycine-generating enzyme required for sulfatase activity